MQLCEACQSLALIDYSHYSAVHFSPIITEYRERRPETFDNLFHQNLGHGLSLLVSERKRRDPFRERICTGYYPYVTLV